MAKNTATTENVEVKAAEPTFTLKKLREDGVTLFGVDISTFAGATHGLSDDKQYTIKELYKLIEAWRAKEAK